MNLPHEVGNVFEKVWKLLEEANRERIIKLENPFLNFDGLLVSSMPDKKAQIINQVWSWAFYARLALSARIINPTITKFFNNFLSEDEEWAGSLIFSMSQGYHIISMCLLIPIIIATEHSHWKSLLSIPLRDIAEYIKIGSGYKPGQPEPQDLLTLIGTMRTVGYTFKEIAKTLNVSEKNHSQSS